MAASPLQIRVGTVPGSELRQQLAPVRAAVTKAVAQATVDRVQARVSHPATAALKAVGINQYQAEIRGPRGGPGIIRPVHASVLVFTVGGKKVFAKHVRGVGFGPLIEAEAKRVTTSDVSDITTIIS